MSINCSTAVYGKAVQMVITFETKEAYDAFRNYHIQLLMLGEKSNGQEIKSAAKLLREHILNDH